LPTGNIPKTNERLTGKSTQLAKMIISETTELTNRLRPPKKTLFCFESNCSVH
jgi:hypothetical protein